MTTSLTCRHWLPKETPGWAVRMQMAVCATLRTKATTFSHRHACSRHTPADAKVAAARAEWLAKVDPPRQGTPAAPSPAGHSRREVGLFHGAAKGVK